MRGDAWSSAPSFSFCSFGFTLLTCLSLSYPPESPNKMSTSSFHSPEFADRPTQCIVSLPTIAENFNRIKELVGDVPIMAIIKANAYGHGLIRCGQHFQDLGVHSLGVAYVEEAEALRHAGVSIPILVLGGLLSSQVEKYIDLGLDITAPSVSKLKTIEEAAARLKRRARVHLKVDTGLERLGTHYYSIEPLLEAAARAKNIDVVGVFSHFADVRLGDLSLAKVQLERFLEVCHKFSKLASQSFLRHITGSAGVLAMPDSWLDLVRPGLILYGVYPDETFSKLLDLKPALTLKSTVVYFKVVKKGAGVSYGHRWHADRDTRVVTIPIGHGDGFARSLSNRGSVLIGGKRYPIIGSICMDQLMVDIGPDGVAYNGDEVTLIGEQGNERVSVEELASLSDTVPWEVLVRLNERIPRKYV